MHCSGDWREMRLKLMKINANVMKQAAECLAGSEEDRWHDNELRLLLLTVAAAAAAAGSYSYGGVNAAEA